MNSKFLASLIKTERKRLGWTQQRMADIGGVSKSSQVGYEAGARSPDMRYLRRVASNGADAMYLLFGERAKPTHSAPFNWVVHDQILKVIESVLEEQSLSLSFERKMQLLRLLIAHFELTDRVDVEYLRSELKKAA